MEVAMTEQGTLKELNVKPGDVVEWLDLEKDNIFTVISASVITEGLYQGEVRARLEGYGGGIFDKEQFRIISRAAQATPTHDLTAITTPFGLLDEATQEALRAHGGPYEAFGWAGFVACDPQWKNTITYRVKPSPVRKTVRTEANMTDSGLLTAAHYGHTRIPVTVVFETVDGVIDLASYKVEAR